MDGAAFEGDAAGDEPARILVSIGEHATQLSRATFERLSPSPFPALRDINGNRVGELRIEP